MLNENSATLLSATQQVYQSLARLIKLCDEVLLRQNMNSEDSHLLSSDNVKEIVDLLEDAVRVSYQKKHKLLILLKVLRLVILEFSFIGATKITRKGNSINSILL